VPEPSETNAHDHPRQVQGDREKAHHHERGFHMDFSQVERFAKHFDDPKRDAWQKPQHVIALMQLQPGQVVADVGAGTGYFLGYLSKAVAPKGQVLGLDVEPAMVEYMTHRAREQRWPNVEARTVPYDDPQLPAGKIDRVLIVNTWHHIDARGAYAQKLARSLTATGAVFVVDFTLESDMGPPPNHRLHPQRVVDELQAGGLDAHILEEELPKQYVVKAMRKR
jgi:ubiquinone/menaquinone biosynthesis C-methylase UbiE